MKYLFFSALLLSCQASYASGVSENARKLQKLMGQYARNDSYQVSIASPLAMVKNYIFAKYNNYGNVRIAEQYKFVQASELSSDQELAGTISHKSALAAISTVDTISSKQKSYAKSLIDEIDTAGGSFGFDGFEQNGCAAPTNFLLVIDPQGEVFGIDLSPCTES